MKNIFKTTQIILASILLSSNVACAANSVDKNQTQNYSSYKPCAHVSPSKVSKCIK